MSHPVKTIIIFANGDPRKATTWSNVPCCIVRQLEQKDLRVHTVNLFYHPLQQGYDHVVRKVLRLFLLPFGIHPPYYVHTRLHRWCAERKIRHAVRSFPDACCCLFFSYLFYNRYNTIPSMLFGDWPIPFDLQRKGRRPSFLYRRVIRQEEEAITHARHVLSVFQLRAVEMQRAYPTAAVRFIGNLFVNNCYGTPPDVNALIHKKRKSGILLFVGKPDRYRHAAQQVVDALALLLSEEPWRALQLHIIGMEDQSLTIPPALPVVCHGYLDKDHREEHAEYYRLLMDARMIINPSPCWAAYSSLVEAMYFYTPVIVSPFDAFTDAFGQTIDFGCYTTPDARQISDHIRYLCDTPNYPLLCKRAHHHVKDNTCTRFVDELIHLIEP